MQVNTTRKTLDPTLIYISFRELCQLFPVEGLQWHHSPMAYVWFSCSHIVHLIQVRDKVKSWGSMVGRKQNSVPSIQLKETPWQSATCQTCKFFLCLVITFFSLSNLKEIVAGCRQLSTWSELDSSTEISGLNPPVNINLPGTLKLLTSPLVGINSYNALKIHGITLIYSH